MQHPPTRRIKNRHKAGIKGRARKQRGRLPLRPSGVVHPSPSARRNNIPQSRCITIVGPKRVSLPSGESFPETSPPCRPSARHRREATYLAPSSHSPAGHFPATKLLPVVLVLYSPVRPLQVVFTFHDHSAHSVGACERAPGRDPLTACTFAPTDPPFFLGALSP